MSYSPALIVHICGGSLGLLSGTAAMAFRKGSPPHVLAGKVFVASMLTIDAFGGSNRPLRLLSTLGLGQHLPRALFNTTLYLVLTILPLILLIFWVVRVRLTNAYNGKSMTPGGLARFVEQKPAPRKP